ncbi:hypothetical protein ACOMHN_013310 [Nucella lapillus]
MPYPPVPYSSLCPSSLCPSSLCPSSLCPRSLCPSSCALAPCALAPCALGPCALLCPSSLCPRLLCPSSLCPRSLCPSSLCPSSLCPSSLCPSSLCPSSLCPSSLCPSSLCPSSLCPSSLCPSSLCPSSLCPRPVNVCVRKLVLFPLRPGVVKPSPKSRLLPAAPVLPSRPILGPEFSTRWIPTDPVEFAFPHSRGKGVQSPAHPLAAVPSYGAATLPVSLMTSALPPFVPYLGSASGFRSAASMFLHRGSRDDRRARQLQGWFLSIALYGESTRTRKRKECLCS